MSKPTPDAALMMEPVSTPILAASRRSPFRARLEIDVINADSPLIGPHSVLLREEMVYGIVAVWLEG